jgi:Holliday junction resolvase RusA-like endonuclease
MCINGRVIHNRSRQLKQWRTTIAHAFPTNPITDPISLTLRFQIARKRTVTRPLPTVAPDLDKLSRAVLDALTGILYRDDSQVIELRASKTYDTPGVWICVN